MTRKRIEPDEYLGKKIGRWSILSISDEKSKDGRLMVLCRCDCGVERNVTLKNIANGHSVSCGCYKKDNASLIYTIDETGKRYGNLLIIKKHGVNSDQKATWDAVCDCGAHTIVAGKDLRRGVTNSCRVCGHKKGSIKRTVDHTGERYGKLVILSRSDDNPKKSVCKCDCGNVKEIATSSLVTGFTKSCECFKTEVSSSFEHRVRLSASIQGVSVDGWQDFLTPSHIRIRNSESYQKWRDSVFERDNYTCQRCGLRSKKGCNVKLNAHHLLNFKTNKELRLDITNGVTLCYACHSQKIKGSFHSRYGTKNNTKEQFNEFIETKSG